MKTLFILLGALIALVYYYFYSRRALKTSRATALAAFKAYNELVKTQVTILKSFEKDYALLQKPLAVAHHALKVGPNSKATAFLKRKTWYADLSKHAEHLWNEEGQLSDAALAEREEYAALKQQCLRAGDAYNDQASIFNDDMINFPGNLIARHLNYTRLPSV